jgi:hypothetical protein
MGGVQLAGNPAGTGGSNIHLRALILRLFLPLLLVSLLLTACGGNDASTAEPTSTPTTASSNNGSSSETTPFSEEERIFVGAGTFEEVPLSLNEGDVLKIDYKSEVRVSPGFGGTAAQERAIRIAVVDPDGNIIVDAPDDASGSLEINVESRGEHRIILENRFPLEALTVTLNYSVNM